MSKVEYLGEFQVTVEKADNGLGNDERDCIRETWKKDGVIYRGNDLPSVNFYYQETGELVQQEWHDETGQLHRDGDLPAIILRNDEEGVREEYHLEHGVLHRNKNRPAIVRWHGDDIFREEYFVHGSPHRDRDLPAYILRDIETGVLLIERYAQNGKTHRDHGRPAEILREESTGVQIETRYKVHGKYFREDNKPVFIHRAHDTGKIKAEKYAHEMDDEERPSDDPAAPKGLS